MTNQRTINAVKDLAKTPYAWEYLVMRDGGALCHTCARQEFPLIGRSTRDNARDGWAAAGVDVNWDDTELTCDNCGHLIEFAYGTRVEDDEHTAQ